MTDSAVLRVLMGFISPNRMQGGIVIFDNSDPRKWAARIEVGGHERWFKGKGKDFKEEVWTPGEDPEKQVCHP